MTFIFQGAKPMKWRKDIQGLRAFAVINLLLFLTNSKIFPNGFTGTYMFFVISGYLARIKLDRSFDIQTFKNYTIRRLKRILPAYYFTALLIIIFTWLHSNKSANKLSAKTLKAFISIIGGNSGIQYYFEQVFFKLRKRHFRSNYIGVKGQAI